ncbi:MAG TPA: lytic transglycosylase domain-containing protein [Streptosporangiaceae bacterium]|nr:lytic transglycosylase domain-containing protein [Streptosporangiaceae bacterium]
MKALAHRATDRRFILSRYRIPLRKPFELIATAVKRFVSARHKINFQRPSRVATLATVTASVAAISLGTALLWPASAASNSRAAAPRPQAVSHAAATIAFADPAMDSRTARPGAAVASVHDARLQFVKAEKAHKAAKRRLAQEQAAQQTQAAQSASSGSSNSPQQIASAMLGSFGWGQEQFGCLDSLWSQESGWNPSASNPSSGAYGIPQALPGSKMASSGADWQSNPATQIRWGLGYIQGLYGSPCGAWGHEQSTGWY